MNIEHPTAGLEQFEINKNPDLFSIANLIEQAMNEIISNSPADAFITLQEAAKLISAEIKKEAP